MIAITNGIVLRKLKYGDSSQIIHVFTQRFGLQSYILKGLGRNKKSTAKGNLLFPAALLKWNVYYKEERHIKLIKDVHPSYFYKSLCEDIVKNSVAVFAMEVLHNLLIPDDVQPELFDFTREFLIALDQEGQHAVANYPLFFLVQSGRIAGYQLLGQYSDTTPFLDLREGRFSSINEPGSVPILADRLPVMSAVNAALSLAEIRNIRMGQGCRQAILQQFLAFFEMHMPHFRTLKSVAVLSGILS
ncbi:MAG TPA: recombination protein O N-terminal domain-containing protein [Edaphocola sp.]|nr:recombination protein O N-terminal domain-containing protein [Edaphocola sp.]